MKRILAVEYPELVPEWMKNNVITSMDVTVGSHKKVWWKGKCGHEWKAKIADRTDGHGCPICSRQSRIHETVNELIRKNPDINIIWSEINAIAITTASASPRRMYLWRCRICGDDFRASVGYMLNGAVCPSCRKHISEQNYMDMLEYKILLLSIASPLHKKSVTSISTHNALSLLICLFKIYFLSFMFFLSNFPIS